MKFVMFLSFSMAITSSLLLAQVNLKSMAAQVNSELSGLEPQKIFDTSAAMRLRSDIEADISSHNGVATLEVLRTEAYDSPSWQVAASCVTKYISATASSAEQLTMLKGIFIATVIDGDHWLNYDSPRGWTNPYTFRYRIARMIIGLQRGEPFVGAAIPDQDLLRDDPMEWLVSNASAIDLKASSDIVAAVKPTASEPTDSSKNQTMPNQNFEEEKIARKAESSRLSTWALAVIVVAVFGVLTLLLRWFLRSRSL